MPQRKRNDAATVAERSFIEAPRFIMFFDEAVGKPLSIAEIPKFKRKHSALRYLTPPQFQNLIQPSK